MHHTTGDWLTDPQNIIAMVGIVLSAGFVAFDWLWRSRKVVVYRVQLDTSFGLTPQPPAFPGLRVRLELEESATEIEDGSLVLRRVWNGGSQHIVKDDFSRPLSFEFSGRTVMGVEIAESDPKAIEDMLKENGGLKYEGGRLTIPPVPLNRKNHFKLLVLLSGAGSGVTQQDGFLTGGRIHKGPGTWQGPSRPVMVASAVATLLVGLLVGLAFTRPGPYPPVDCASGRLHVYGSTAFEPLVKQVAGKYSASCHNAQITVDATPSLEAIRTLESAGNGRQGGADGQITMSDGAARGTHPRLTAHPVAVVIFSSVVNQRTGIHNLTTAQLRDIYAGHYTNWKQLGGNDLRISVVSRNSDSGTRRTFEDTVLHTTEQGITSDDCTTPLSKDAQFVRCERSTTQELLDQVDNTPGAIGYAEFSATALHRNVQRIQIDGHDADIETAKQHLYPYWTVETFYTYGDPQPGSQAGTFLKYLDSAEAKVVVRTYGHVPCSDPQSGSLCRTP